MLEFVSFLHIFVYQIINVNSTIPCFLNATAGIDMWKNCGATTDFIQFALLPFMWVTGGFFPVILAAVLIIASWVKYHKTAYPILVGIAFLPISYSLWPAQFLNFAIILAGVGIGLYLVNAYINATTEQ